jgi:peptide/nickel transport system ATP-binding protein
MMQSHTHAAQRDTTVKQDRRAALRVSGLSISANSQIPAARAILQNVTFEAASGEVVGILGESGAGKTTLALSLLGLLPQGMVATSGSIHLDDLSLVGLSEERWQSIRGNIISVVYQDSSTLNPVLRVEDQVAEVIRAHRKQRWARSLEEARDTLKLVGLAEPRIGRSYPHQLSGGQRQRVAIAQALACGPQVLIADEPTASLDATTTFEILNLLRSIRKQFHTSIVLISHQPEVLGYLSDRLIVLYGGQIVEEGPARRVLEAPLHPYMRELMNCRCPLLSGGQGKARWPFIAGGADRIASHGCVFEGRCSIRKEECRIRIPSLQQLDHAHSVRCIEYSGEVA